MSFEGSDIEEGSDSESALLGGPHTAPRVTDPRYLYVFTGITIIPLLFYFVTQDFSRFSYWEFFFLLPSYASIFLILASYFRAEIMPLRGVLMVSVLYASYGLAVFLFIDAIFVSKSLWSAVLAIALVLCALFGMHAAFDGIILSRQAKRVPAHWMKD